MSAWTRLFSIGERTAECATQGRSRTFFHIKEDHKYTDNGIIGKKALTFGEKPTNEKSEK